MDLVAFNSVITSSTFYYPNLNIDYKDLYDFHVQKKNMITIIASAKEHIIPYGVCNLNTSGQFKNIKEKPKINFLASSGIYVIHPSVLRLIPKNKRFDFPDLVAAVKRKKIKIGVFPIDDNSWADVGQWSEYKKTLNLLGYKETLNFTNTLKKNLDQQI